MEANITRMDLRAASHWLISKAAGKDRILDQGKEQRKLPVLMQSKLNKVRERREGDRMNVADAVMWANSGLDLTKGWEKVLGRGDSRFYFTREEINRIKDPDLKSMTQKLFETAVAVKKPYAPGELAALNKKYAKARKAAVGTDKVLSKKEARKLRQIARVQFEKATEPSKVADAFVADLRAMRGMAQDKKVDHYMGTVIHEFKERATHQRAANALRDHLVKNQKKLSPLLKAVDVEDISRWGVDASNHGGVYLRVSLKDGIEVDNDAVEEELRHLLATTPSLRAFGGVAVTRPY